MLESYWKPERSCICHTCCIILLICLSVPHILQSCVWETPIPPISKKSIVCRKTLVRIITGSPYRAHTAPLLLANRLLSLSEINSFVDIFMYNCINGILPTTFFDYFVRNRDVHQCNTRQADDLRVPFGRLDERKFRIKIHGAQVWNSLPRYIRSATDKWLQKEVKKFSNRQEYSHYSDSILMLTLE